MLTIMWTDTRSTTSSAPRVTCFLCRRCCADPPPTSITMSNIHSRKMSKRHQRRTQKLNTMRQWHGFTTSLATLVSLCHPVLITQVLSCSWDGRPFVHDRHEPGCCAPFGWGELGPHLIQCGLGRGLPPYQVASWPIQPFGHNRHGSKSGVAVPLVRGAGSPSNTVSSCLRPTAIPSSHLAATDMGRKLWGGLCPFGGMGWFPIWQCGKGWGLPPYHVASWSI